MVDARDFGWPVDPLQQALEDVEPYLHLSPKERYVCFIDLMRFMEKIWNSIEPGRQARYGRAQEGLDDPGRWWERVPGDDLHA
jgi:hypothetical protein